MDKCFEISTIECNVRGGGGGSAAEIGITCMQVMNM